MDRHEHSQGREFWTLFQTACRRLIDDQITTVAASVAFFVILAVFPGLAAVIAIVSTFADPDKVDGLLSALSGVIPSESVEFLKRHVGRLSGADAPDHRRPDLAIAPILGLGVLLWSANRGTKALFRALNDIYEQEEERGFLAITAVTLTFTIGAIVFLVFSVGAIIIFPLVLDSLMAADTRAKWLGLLRWPALLLVVSAGLASLFRFGPTRQAAHWYAIAWGSSLAAVLWIGGSLLFSWYISSFGGLTDVYGPLSAVIGFMVWIWLSAIAVLVGAEVDAALQG